MQEILLDDLVPGDWVLNAEAVRCSVVVVVAVIVAVADGILRVGSRGVVLVDRRSLMGVSR